MIVTQFAVVASSNGGDGPNPAALIGFLSIFAIGLAIIMMLILILSIGFAFAFPLIVDRKLSGLDAVKLSFKAALANFWRLFGLLLLNWLLR